MIRYNFDQAIDRLERLFITGEIKIATGEVWQDIDLLRGIITERELRAGHGAANAAGLIQGQTERHTSLRGLTPHRHSEHSARFGCPATLKTRPVEPSCQAHLQRPQRVPVRRKEEAARRRPLAV